MNTSIMNCEKCNKELKPASAKIRANGEQTYCGFLPCACDKTIMTDYGTVEPVTEEHKMLLASGNYSANDIL